MDNATVDEMIAQRYRNEREKITKPVFTNRHDQVTQKVNRKAKRGRSNRTRPLESNKAAVRAFPKNCSSTQSLKREKRECFSLLSFYSSLLVSQFVSQFVSTRLSVRLYSSLSSSLLVSQFVYTRLSACPSARHTLLLYLAQDENTLCSENTLHRQTFTV